MGELKVLINDMECKVLINDMELKVLINDMELVLINGMGSFKDRLMIWLTSRTDR